MCYLLEQLLNSTFVFFCLALAFLLSQVVHAFMLNSDVPLTAFIVGDQHFDQDGANIRCSFESNGSFQRPSQGGGGVD